MANMIQIEEKVKGYEAKKRKIEEGKRLNFEAYYHQRKDFRKILNFEKFLNVLMKKLKASSDRGAKNASFNVEDVSKLLL